MSTKGKLTEAVKHKILSVRIEECEAILYMAKDLTVDQEIDTNDIQGELEYRIDIYKQKLRELDN